MDFKFNNWFSSLKRKNTKKQNKDTTTKDNENSLEMEKDNFLMAHNNNNNNNNYTNNNNNNSNNNSNNSDNKNIFQRIKFKMDFKFNNLSDSKNNITHDNNISNEIDIINNENNESLENTFTHKYCKKITRKWLDQNTGQNLIMYKTCMEMINHVWYWGEISRQHAQNKLTNKPNGSFLVRDSESGGSQFTLSFRINNCTYHYRLQYFDNYWHFYELQYESIVELIEDIQFKSSDSSFICFVKTNIMAPPIPVFLRYPISRYIEIPKLQELCKQSLLQYIPEIDATHRIEKLPIPVKLQEFLIEKNSFMF